MQAIASLDPNAFPFIAAYLGQLGLDVHFGTREDIRIKRLEQALRCVDKLRSRADRGLYVHAAVVRAHQRVKDLVKDLHDTVRAIELLQRTRMTSLTACKLPVRVVLLSAQSQRCRLHFLTPGKSRMLCWFCAFSHRQSLFSCERAQPSSFLTLISKGSSDMAAYFLSGCIPVCNCSPALLSAAVLDFGHPLLLRTPSIIRFVP